MNITVFGSMGMLNVGDEAYIEASINEIRTAVPDTTFSFISFDPENSRTTHQIKEACFLPRMNKKLFTKPKWLRRIIITSHIFQYLLILVFGTAFFCPSQEVRDLIKLIKKSNIVAAFGGGLLNDNYTGSAIVYLLIMQLAQRFGKKTVFMAQSIGPINNPLNIWLSSKILKKVNLITIREELSREFLSNIGIPKENVSLTVCPAFLLPPSLNTNNIYSKWNINTNTPLIGLAIREWVYPNESDPSKANNDFINMITVIVDKISADLDATIIIIPTILSDINLGEKVLSRSTNQSRVKVIGSLNTPREVVGICGQLNLLITTNFHPLVFATSQGVPSITLALTGHKTTGFAKSAGLSEFIIDEQHMNAKSIIHTTHLLWKNINQTRSKLQKEIPKLKTLASDSINRLTQEILT